MQSLSNSLKSKTTTPQPRVGNAVSATLMTIIILIGLGASVVTGQFDDGGGPYWLLLSIVVGIVVFLSLSIAQQWEKAVVLRLGRFQRLAGPGMFFIIPIVDSVTAWIDHRVQLTPFNAQRTLTRDTVPVDIDAVLFWIVWDAQKAALEVANYGEAIAWAAQTALRDIIGKTNLADILVGREKLGAALQHLIDERTSPWGITVQSVEIRDVIIPSDLENAMSRQAQAERERQARVILGESEEQIAHSFRQAAQIYGGDVTALHLRAMNMLFEGLKEKGAMIIVPSSAVETMNLGAITGLTGLAQVTSLQATAATPGPVQPSQPQPPAAPTTPAAPKPAN